MIRVIDYGVGNIQAFLTMYKRLGIPAERARRREDLADAKRLILPGVGAFDHAMQLLNDSGLRESLDEQVLGRGVPVLGVCVGMQMLASGSEEGKLPGLNWIPGSVCAFASEPASVSLPMPHMGWNDVIARPSATLFSGFPAQPRFYFLHSYFYRCDNRTDVAATASYGLEFDCVVSRGHIHGMQCHPEKSHRFGAQLLKNFAEL
jgi:glutamine amidotransferase